MTDIPTPEEMAQNIAATNDRATDEIIEQIFAKMREARCLIVTVHFHLLGETAEKMLRERLEEKGWKVEVTRTEQMSMGGFFTLPASVTMKVWAPGVGDDQ